MHPIIFQEWRYQVPLELNLKTQQEIGPDYHDYILFLRYFETHSYSENSSIGLSYPYKWQTIRISKLKSQEC